MPSETKKEYFDRMNNWEENFTSMEEFIGELNHPSSSSGSLGRVCAKTILRLEEKNKSLVNTLNEIKNLPSSRMNEVPTMAHIAIKNNKAT